MRSLSNHYGYRPKGDHCRERISQTRQMRNVQHRDEHTQGQSEAHGVKTRFSAWNMKQRSPSLFRTEM